LASGIAVPVATVAASPVPMQPPAEYPVTVPQAPGQPIFGSSPPRPAVAGRHVADIPQPHIAPTDTAAKPVFRPDLASEILSKTKTRHHDATGPVPANKPPSKIRSASKETQAGKTRKKTSTSAPPGHTASKSSKTKRHPAGKPANDETVKAGPLVLSSDMMAEFPPESDDLEIVIENFRVVSPAMAERLIAKNSSVLGSEISFNNEYSLLDASIEAAGDDRILLLTWKCLKIPSPGEKEKLAFTLLKKGKNLWGFGPTFRDGQHFFIRGDVIFGKIKLNRESFADADQLGIRLNKFHDNQWDGLKILGKNNTDQKDKRLLIDLGYCHQALDVKK
ncbi:MAG: hypothetical protein GY765_34880, partial [bacterium]|nr:hypothetical protein [bacterium]